MKNFPERDPFDELEKRLQNFTEKPDDLVWKNIDAALRPQRTAHLLPWVDYFASAMTVVLLVFFLPSEQAGQTQTKSEHRTEQSRVTRNKSRDLLSQIQEKEKDSRVSTLKRALDKRLSENKSLLSQPNQKRIEILGIAKESKTQESVRPGAAGALAGEGAQIELTNGGALLLNAEELHTDSADHYQKNTEKENRIPKRRPVFYANISPSLSFQRAIPIASDQVVVRELSDVSILSAERFGISLDAGIQGVVSKRLEYYGGLSIYHQHQTLEYSYQKDSQVEVESSGDNNYTVTPKYSMGKVNYEMLNLGIQAGLLYKLYGKNPSHKVGGGLSYQQGFLKGNSDGYKNSESSYLSYQLFYRSEVRVGSRVRVFVQPTFLQSFRVRETLDAPFNLKPYRAGIGFGIIYDL